MLSAQLITIGTEIVSGEVVNTNAAWLSQRLEELGVRVYSHLSVRDQKEEMLAALNFGRQPLVFVTGGLGPTSDDITRDILAIYTKQPLDFDNQVWNDLKAVYERRQLPLREAHRWQCHFPRGSKRLNNSAGTALGFYQEFEGRHFFVLPGPPRELEAMWAEEVKPRVTALLKPTKMDWVRWTCLGAPESEVAEKVEPVIQNSGVEVGYRAQIPYVRVKVYVDPEKQKSIVECIDQALGPWIVARGFEDLAEELLMNWPGEELNLVDSLTGVDLLSRLTSAQRVLEKNKAKCPQIRFKNFGSLEKPGIELSAKEEVFTTRLLTLDGQESSTEKTLSYKVPLSSERGKRSATEWAIWTALSALKARAAQV